MDWFRKIVDALEAFLYEPAPAPAAPVAQSLPARPSSTPEGRGRAALMAIVAALEARDWPAAAEASQAAFLVYHGNGDRRSAALCQKVIALLIEQIADNARARAAYGAARRMLCQAGLTADAARMCLLAAQMEARHRQFPASFALLREAMSLAGQAEEHGVIVEAHCLWARIEAGRGKRAEAKARMDQAVAAAETAGDPDLVAQTGAILAELDLAA